MGGRGSSGANVVSRAIHVDGEGFHKEFIQMGKKVYDVTGRIPQEINRTLSELETAAKNSGLKIKNLSKSEVEKLEKQRAEDRKKTDQFLNDEYARNKHADQASKSYRAFRRTFGGRPRGI